MKVYKYHTNAVSLQDGANSAFQEAVGDSIMYGVMAPQHLQRLGLINDTSQGDVSKNMPVRFLPVMSTKRFYFFNFFMTVIQAN
jgi:peptidyl-dipeptidase A